MHEVTARFIGEDGSMGFNHGQLYLLKVSGNYVVEPTTCPYDTVEAFLKNWSVPLMGWGEDRSSGSVGTTGQVEDAHRFLDEAEIEPGPLASRALKAALIVKAAKHYSNRELQVITEHDMKRVDL